MDALLTMRREAARRRRIKLIPDVAVTLLLVVLCFYFLAPVVWLILASTKSVASLYTSSPLWFGANFQLWNNMAHALTLQPSQFSFWFISFSSGQFVVWFANSLLYTIPSVFLSALTGSAAGFGLAKYHFRGRTVLLFLVMFALVFPGGALVIPTFLVGSALHLVDNPLGIILPQIANAFGVVVFYNFFSQQFSTEIVHAARIDGASEYRIYAAIALPAARAILATLSIFAFVASWNNFFLPNLMAPSDDRKPLAVGLGIWAQSTAMGGGAGQGGGQIAGNGIITVTDVITGAMMVSVPIIILFVALRKYWSSGFMGGGLKG